MIIFAHVTNCIIIVTLDSGILFRRFLCPCFLCRCFLCRWFVCRCFLCRWFLFRRFLCRCFLCRWFVYCCFLYSWFVCRWVVDAPQPQIGHHEIVETEFVLPVFQFLFGRLGNLDIHRGFLLLNCSHDSLRILVQHHGIERFLLRRLENHARGIPNADGRREHVLTLSPFLPELFPDKHTP